MDDLDLLHDIVKDATRHMDEQGIPQWDEIYPNNEILMKDIERQELYVIETEGRLAGSITLSEDQPPEYASVPWRYVGRALVVKRLSIAPHCQRRGLASRLMDFAEETAAAAGYDCIRLMPLPLILYPAVCMRNVDTGRLASCVSEKGNSIAMKKRKTITKVFFLAKTVKT